MNHCILILDDVIKTFSLAGSGLDIQYTFAYKDKQDVFKNIMAGDKVIGYIDDPADRFRYVFEVIRKKSDKECIFRKKMEIEEGPALKDTNSTIVSLVSANKSRTLFLEINEGQYNDLVRLMLNKSRKILESREEESSKPICFETSLKMDYPYNRIVFGAPGTGKSFTINSEKDKLLGKCNDEDYERVTFHPDYSYAGFVGTYKPVPCIDSDGKDAITYKYVPGPFMRMLVKALRNGRTEKVRPFLLIIEEINRANVAAVFGDVFQLLDRQSNNGVSEYPIEATEDMKKYLSDELGGAPEDYLKIKIPNNLFIWATMNSADQGVFPMDTAFKRRWTFTYIGINDNDKDLQGKTVEIGSKVVQKVEWNKLRKAINDFLAKQKINEDKQLGPYFISRDIVVPAGNEIDKNAFADVFKSKVIMYLFEDAAKQKRPTLFEGCFDKSARYSDICREFDEKGIGIFNHDISLASEPEDIAGTSTTTK